MNQSDSRPIQPCFIFSLPRSGSTLLQRILASHPEVATASEPWLLLPLLHARRPESTYSLYGHRSTAVAVNDFVDSLDRGEQAWAQGVRAMALSLYRESAGPEPRIFLDKTPRYHLVIPEILDVFPEARFIFLWRDPLSVIASINDTFAKGRWRFHEFRVDIFHGLENLVRGADLAKERAAERVLELRFEDLVADPEGQVERIRTLLGLSDAAGAAEMCTGLSATSLSGRMGDKRGEGRDTVVSAPLERWRGLLDSPLRKGFAKKYLRWIGAERLSRMGYDQAELLARLENNRANCSRLGSDLVRAGYGALNCLFELRMFLDKRKEARRLGRWHQHN